ncbi:MAG: SDR family NAD(P)-dependent oxidoreductase [Candidatus Kerfeldbacteria bacterium]|nr:SDR family NAD(P)-dependent oxidoreductase [Candidatus Kerfeldbacteria bacterium]
MAGAKGLEIHRDRVMIVTGGTGGLGQAVTRKLLDGGATVIATYLNQDEADRLAASTSSDQRQRLNLTLVDVTNPSSVNALVAHVLESHGRIDGLVNVVGGYQYRPFLEISPADWQRQLQLNLDTTFLVTRAVLKPMVEAGYGRIVSVGSQSAMAAAPFAAHYNAAKAAVASLMATLSHEFGPNITANTVLPGTIDTLANRQAMPEADTSQWVSPETIAHMISRLLEASNVTSGQHIPVTRNR